MREGIAPGPDGPIREQGETVTRSCGNRGDARQARWRCGPVGFKILAPSRDRSIRAQRHAMPGAGGDGDDVRQTHDLQWDRAVGPRDGVAKLTLDISPPPADRAIRQ